MITGNTYAASETQGIRELAAQITEAASISMSRVGEMRRGIHLLGRSASRRGDRA